MRLSIAVTALFAGTIAQAAGAVNLAKRADDAATLLQKSLVQMDTVGKVVGTFDGSEDSRDTLASAGVSCVTNLTALAKTAAGLEPLTEAQGAALRDPAMSLLNSTKAFLSNLDGKLELFEKDEICEPIMGAVKQIESSLHDVLANITTKATAQVQEGSNGVIKQIDEAFDESIELLEGCPPPKSATSTPAAASNTPAPTSASSGTVSVSATATATSGPQTGSAAQLQISQVGLVVLVAYNLL